MAAVDEKVTQIIVEQLGVDGGEATSRRGRGKDSPRSGRPRLHLQALERWEVTLGRRVVVTGLGLICGVGNTTDEVWKALLAGKSGVDRITSFDASKFACQIAAEVEDFDPLKFIEKKELKK